MEAEGPTTAKTVCYQINTPVLNGGAAEQRTSINVVPEAAAPEEEDSQKYARKVTP